MNNIVPFMRMDSVIRDHRRELMETLMLSMTCGQWHRTIDDIVEEWAIELNEG